MISAIRAASNYLRTRPRLGRYALKAIPDRLWTLHIEGIGPMRLNLRRNRAFWLRDPLETERVPFAMLRHLVRPGDTVYDVGANMGLYSRYLVSALGAGRVVAFEPMSANRLRLTENLELGGIAARVTVLSLALADADESAEFQVDDMQSASATLSKVTGGEACVGRSNLGLGPITEQVLCRRLDTAVAEAGLPVPDVIKIDVEGAEAMMLRGAAGVLTAYGPRLLVELHGVEMIHEVLSILHELGYACAGKVEPRIHPSGYGRVDPTILPAIKGPYDVHFVVASRRAEDLPTQLEAGAER